MQVNIKTLYKNVQIPVRQTEWSAGADLHAYIDTYEGFVTIKQGESMKIKTGIAVELPKGMVGFIFARSGLASKKGLVPSNCVGVADEDYRGEIMVSLHNQSKVPQTVIHGERIAQYVIVPYIAFEFEEVEALTETERGKGGFGSTGKS